MTVPAHNESRRTDVIDVHGLEVLKATAMTEAALYAEQKRGGSKLSVIVGRGRESAEGLKNFIIDKMTGCVWDCYLHSTFSFIVLKFAR